MERREDRNIVPQGDEIVLGGRAGEERGEHVEENNARQFLLGVRRTLAPEIFTIFVRVSSLNIS